MGRGEREGDVVEGKAIDVEPDGWLHWHAPEETGSEFWEALCFGVSERHGGPQTADEGDSCRSRERRVRGRRTRGRDRGGGRGGGRN